MKTTSKRKTTKDEDEKIKKTQKIKIPLKMTWRCWLKNEYAPQNKDDPKKKAVPIMKTNSKMRMNLYIKTTKWVKLPSKRCSHAGVLSPALLYLQPQRPPFARTNTRLNFSPKYFKTDHFLPRGFSGHRDCMQILS